MTTNNYKSELKSSKNSLLIQSGLRIFFLGIALIGTFWLIAALNSGNFFLNPNSPTAILLGISAQKTH